MIGEQVENTIEERAKEFLKLSGNCAQSSFATLQEQFGLNSEDILPTPRKGQHEEIVNKTLFSMRKTSLTVFSD